MAYPLKRRTAFGPSNRPKRDAGISVRVWGWMGHFGGVYPETHHVEDRLLPLKQMVRHLSIRALRTQKDVRGEMGTTDRPWQRVSL
jgi:hypothetical protein